MKRLTAEIQRTRAQIDGMQQELDGMMKDYSVPLGSLIETQRRLRELIAYLNGLEYAFQMETSVCS